MRNYIIHLILDPGFLGALIGSALSGFVAISVFWLSKRNENKQQHEEYISSYMYLIFHFQTIINKVEQLKEVTDAIQNSEFVKIEDDTSEFYKTPNLYGFIADDFYEKNIERINDELQDSMNHIVNFKYAKLPVEQMNLYLEVYNLIHYEFRYTWEEHLIHLEFNSLISITTMYKMHTYNSLLRKSYNQLIRKWKVNKKYKIKPFD